MEIVKLNSVRFYNSHGSIKKKLKPLLMVRFDSIFFTNVLVYDLKKLNHSLMAQFAIFWFKLQLKIELNREFFFNLLV